MHKLSIAIIGQGAFGRALAKLFDRYVPDVKHAFFDRQTNSELIAEVSRLADYDVVIPAVPIGKFEQVIRQIAPHLKSDCLAVDVCSVKLHPVQVMQKLLPESVQILATHPMFGPNTLEATGYDLSGLRLVMHPVRIEEEMYLSLIHI